MINAFAVLQAFRGSGEWVTSVELGRRAKLPAKVISELVETLVDLGLVVQNDEAGYHSGTLLLSLPSRNSCRQPNGSQRDAPAHLN